MKNHPAQPRPGEVIRHDAGGWISGPSITTEYVAAESVRPGDKILYGALVAEVAAWPVAASWREGGQQMHGVEIECRDVSGTGLLYLYRPRHHELERIANDDVELCPQAKVPCEPNLFDMCKTCGRDLSGNADA
jgi:hypothetical protein